MSFYTNPRVDELLEIGRTSTDQEARKAAYLEAQAIVWEEVPCIFLQCPEDLYAYSSDLQNFGVYSDGDLRIPEFSF
jgi:peptide/nickel transport system substrate-binding protein